MTPRKPVLVHITTVPQTLLFLRGQIGYMKSRGFRIVAVSSPGDVLDEVGRSEGIETHALVMPRRITPLGDLVVLFRLVLLFWTLKPDVVHGHTPKGGLLGMMAAALTGVKGRVYTLHGLPMETAAGIRRSLLRLTEQVSCALARRVHAVSESLRRRAAALGVCRLDKIQVLGAGTVNGIDAEKRFAPLRISRIDVAQARRDLAIPSELRIVGYVGRVVRDKGVEDLLEAWMILREEFSDLHLVIVGPEEDQDALPPDAMRRLRSDPRIRMTGYVDSMPATYAMMDVVVLPTYREGFPQVPLEAAAMERPVVATAVTGCVDAVRDGETGMLVPPRDPQALSRALRTYLEDPLLRRRHGTAARSRVLREYRPERLWLHTFWGYESLLGVRRDASGARIPHPPRRTPRRPRPAIDLLLKRSIDVAGALCGLLLLSPVIAVLSVAILATLGRPLFFRQRRPGLRGRVFSVIKFRSMREGKEPDEVRMGWLGRFLRSTSLDEIPQLWNVLRGDMSLVGPRPLLVQYLSLYSPEEARRHDVRPGMTGAVQVSGRNSLAWPDKFALDCWYVDNGSLRVDLRILMRTVGKVFARTGINGPGNASVPIFQGSSLAPTASISPERRAASGFRKSG
jgi:lipopolysaccharide/colanic/teichoic acid biosynthesis glycosyltransferase/glycosyltransferase involved in cell wall biosynthesis